MTNNESLRQSLATRILVLDGGFGTMLQRYDLGKGICNDLLSITNPDIVGEIHNEYLDAGADIITTNSFNANAISLKEYGLADRAREIARAAASVARACADAYSTPDKPRFVAGSMGPTNRTLSMSADVESPASREVEYREMYGAYSEQARGLIEGGADIIIIETIFDTLNAKAAIKAVRDISPGIPLMLSATVSDSSGRTLTGQTVEAFRASVAHAGAMTVGLNCGFGAGHLLPYLRRLAAVASERISVHPNAGLPNVMGEYDETPEKFAADMAMFMREGLVNIVGGCCGTTPEHIRQLAAAARGRGPRPLPERQPVCVLSGLDTLELRKECNFINIGERTNVAGSAKFARLVREGLYDEAISIASAQVRAGAQVVDVCMDAPLIDAPEAMRHFLNLMAAEPDIARVPVMIDSSDWTVIKVGLESVQGKSIVNSISLKEGEEKFLAKARDVMAYGAAAVVMLFDEKGQADTFERKIEVARRAYDLLMSVGFPPEDIIFDPNVLAVATGIPEHDRYARDFIDATGWIKINLPHAKVSGGVSNLSFAFRGNNAVRKAMHAVFLYHAVSRGMDMGIVNPQMVQLYDDIPSELLTLVEDLVLYRREDAADRLTAYARSMMDSGADGANDAADSMAWRAGSCASRIEHALLRGEGEFVQSDAIEAYGETGSAVGVIDTMLMPAMAKVGDLFGQGKMFLPQVVKSARVMKLAVAALQPYITADNGNAGQEKRATVVLATVKGDVHDIGKNIVGLVLACNGYNVVDLGVMTPPEVIVERARECGASVICLSGLITPSLDEMIHVAEEAQRQGLLTPIIVGGATTSDLHTALKIAPVTDAPVIHSTDAANNASIVASLLSPEAAAFVAGIRRGQKILADGYNASRRGAQAVGCRCCMPDTHSDAHVHDGVYSFVPDDVRDRINWSFFFSAWGLPGRYPRIFDDSEKGAEARKLYDDAQRMLDSLDVRLQGVVRTYRASSQGDDMLVFDSGKHHVLPMRRNASTGECAADFADASGGEVTLFALTSGVGLREIAEKYRAEADDYSYMMAKFLCDRLVEAFADKVMHGGCRIAFGYPTAPDHGLKRRAFDILGVEELTDMRLSETCMIIPAESICGMWVRSGYFFDAGGQL